jgi:hypothetical protein
LYYPSLGAKFLAVGKYCHLKRSRTRSLDSHPLQPYRKPPPQGRGPGSNFATKFPGRPPPTASWVTNSAREPESRGQGHCDVRVSHGAAATVTAWPGAATEAAAAHWLLKFKLKGLQSVILKFRVMNSESQSAAASPVLFTAGRQASDSESVRCLFTELEVRRRGRDPRRVRVRSTGVSQFAGAESPALLKQRPGPVDVLVIES